MYISFQESLGPKNVMGAKEIQQFIVNKGLKG